MKPHPVATIAVGVVLIVAAVQPPNRRAPDEHHDYPAAVHLVILQVPPMTHVASFTADAMIADG